MKSGARTTVESDLNRHHVKYEDPLWDEEIELLSKKSWRIVAAKADHGDVDKNFDLKFMQDNKVVFVVPGKDFSKKQAKYFRTPEGMQQLLKLLKDGITNTYQLKKALKTYDQT